MQRPAHGGARKLTDHVFPDQPVPQWVLSVPKRLRYFLAQDPATETAVLLEWDRGGGFSIDA